MTDTPVAGAVPEPAARDVRALVHFGWACAEVRGRYHQILTGRPEAPPEDPEDRHEYTLPLNHERSAAELAIQAEKELAGLATQLGLDVPVTQLPHPPSSTTGTVVEQLRALCKDSGMAEGDKAQHDAWMKIANVFHEWDTVLQDTLPPASATEAAALAKAKDAADASLIRMREAANRTLVAEAITAVPDEEYRWQLRSPIVRVAQAPTTLPAKNSTDTEPVFPLFVDLLAAARKQAFQAGGRLFHV